VAGRIARGQIARGEVRLYQFAAPDKKRPALVLTRNSAIAYLSTVTVAPVTSTIRGVPSEVVLNEEDGMKSTCAINLHNAVTVSQQRLGRRVAQLSDARMNEVCAALRFSLGCDSNYMNPYEQSRFNRR
jgi:mRNA interferase MazF